MSKRRVVITGLGSVNPLALSVADTWSAILAGQSGIGHMDEFDASQYSTQIVGLVKGFDITQYMSAKEARRLDLFVQYALAGADEALKDAGLINQDDATLCDGLDATRIGVAVGSGIGGLTTIENNQTQLLNSGPRRVSPFLIPASVINMAAGNIAIRYGLKGPNFSIGTACTSSAHNIGYGARTIAYGDADLMIVGGSEKGSSALGMAGFSSAKAMSTRNDDPERASRPWDKDRDGFVLADGSGILVLESLEHAQARGATIYAELAGFGMSDDAHHITSPCPDGDGARRAMLNAINDAGIAPSDVSYINAHGTSTLQGDIAETLAIKAVFEKHANQLAISSTKSMSGHLLGAAGALEAILTLLAMRDSKAPATINLDTPDPQCDLDYVPHKARDMRIDVAVSNSFGFGGTNGTLVFKRV